MLSAKLKTEGVKLCPSLPPPCPNSRRCVRPSRQLREPLPCSIGHKEGSTKAQAPLLAACSICSSVSPPVVQTRPFPPSHCGADSYGPRSYAQARLQAKSSRLCISGVTLLNFLGKRHGMCKAVWHPRNSTVQWNPVLEVQLREVTSNPTVHPISPLFVLARSLIPGISC